MTTMASETNFDGAVMLSPDLVPNTEGKPIGDLVTPSTSATSSPSLTPSLSPVSPTFVSLSASPTLTEKENSWFVPASKKSLRTHNPIRSIVDPIMTRSIKDANQCGDGKDQISLALGDPTTYGIIKPCPAVVSAITKAMQSPGIAAGYVNACGTHEARAAIASYHSKQSSEIINVIPEDIIVANGASGALELALTALLDEDSVLLVPRPGFPLYQVIAESHGARVVHYDLLPQSGWECDLNHMESIILHEEEEAMRKNCEKKYDAKNRAVRAILINNPSNPTGAVYSESHLMDIIRVAARHRLPIISDEIYGDMTFANNLFRPMASVSVKLGNQVPIITASGLGKQYLVPGWRLGWIVFSNNKAIQAVKKGAQRLAQVVLGASHLAQVAIPAVLDPPSEEDRACVASWKDELLSIIEDQSNLLCILINQCYGLEVIPAQGAMYAMVKIHVDKFDDTIVDDLTFMKLLLVEENVVVLPGRAFGLEISAEINISCHVFRVVFCAPENIIKIACERIRSFCLRHKEN
mmetsp:Transcript_14800/g.31436  ORF Transcript_14800/g.31436 Transcript_14800/m.31436 type:complete len:525 (+) Transcript_14800:132-1706(+)